MASLLLAAACLLAASAAAAAAGAAHDAVAGAAHLHIRGPAQSAAPPNPSPNITNVFVAGQGGYACYRIPALLRLDSGMLLAFAEARRYSCNDHGAVDIVVRLSATGTSWTELSVVYSESSPARNVTIGNPAPVQLPDGSILLAFCRNNTSWGTLRSPDGVQWGPPTYHPIPPAWSWVATGPPGSTVLLPSGRVIVPFDYNPGPGYTDGANRSAVFFSDDNGATFVQGEAVEGGNEAQAAPLPWLNGSALLLSMRSAGGASRLAALSGDGGVTFSAPWPTIKETQCEASTVALPLHPAGPRVYMSSAFDATQRANLTLHVTGGHDLHTWTPRWLIYPGPAAYSSLAMTGADSLGVLFERDNYAAIGFAALTNVPA